MDTTGFHCTDIRFCGLDNVTCDIAVAIVVSRQWVKFQFGSNYTFYNPSTQAFAYVLP